MLTQRHSDVGTTCRLHRGTRIWLAPTAIFDLLFTTSPYAVWSYKNLRENRLIRTLSEAANWQFALRKPGRQSKHFCDLEGAKARDRPDGRDVFSRGVGDS